MEFRSGAAFASNTIATSRAIVFPGFSEQATARYGVGESQVFGELGYGAALAVVLVLLMAVPLVIIFRFARRRA